MKTQLQIAIQETIKQIVHLNRVQEQVKVTDQELDQAYKEQSKMDKMLRKELRDIEKLEGLSTKAIFHKILGSKEKQLEKERQDYLELSLKDEDIKKTIDLLEYESSILTAKLGSEDGLVGKLEQLKGQREKEIIQIDPKLSKKLLKISDQIEDNFRFKSELEEAIEVGSVCLNLTNQIIGHLSKVRNWGSWQSGGSRSHMRQMMRRDAMDRARNLSYQVKHHLNLFDKELKDVGRHMNFNADTAQFTQFSDFFFNNIITDWIVNNQLNNAIRSAANLRDNLRALLNKLKLELEDTSQAVAKLGRQRDDILTS